MLVQTGNMPILVVQVENDTQKGKNENTTQSPENTQTGNDLEALAANDLPSRLVQLRNGQARSAFAERMGTTESTLRNYEKGISIPRADFLRHICQIFRISPEWLLFGETKSGKTGGQFFKPRALGNPLSRTKRENVLSCPGCVALDRVLQLERAERQSLAKENGELREELARLMERLNLSGA